MLSDKNKKALVGVALAQTASDFSIIQDPDCAAVLCQTQISSHILAWLASLDPACLPKARVILRPRSGFRAPWFIFVTCLRCRFVRNATPL
jgi:hypothetical protein